MGGGVERERGISGEMPLFSFLVARCLPSLLFLNQYQYQLRNVSFRSSLFYLTVK